MRKVVLATRNPHKMDEIRDILLDLPIDLVPMPEDAPEVAEDRDSIRGNAEKKALDAAAALGAFAVADDTGLEVAALDGAPGVHSARYAGEEGDARANNEKLLAQLDGLPREERAASFRCVAVLARPGEVVAVSEAVVEGRILEAPQGAAGFGYDPLFFVEELGRSYAELDAEEKNRVSHRALAFRGLRRALLDLI